MSTSSKDISPIVPKKQRNIFFIVVLAFCLLGITIPCAIAQFYHFPSKLVWVYQQSPVILFSLPIIILLQCLLFRTGNYRSHAVLIFAFLYLGGKIALYYADCKDAEDFIIPALMLLFGFGMLLNLLRSYTLALGPNTTAQKRLLAAECLIPIGSLIGFSFLLCPTKLHPYLFGSSFAPVFMALFAFGCKGDLRPWSQQEEQDKVASPLINKHSISALIIHAIICFSLSFSTVQFLNRFDKLADLFPYGTGIAAMVLFSRIITIKLTSSPNKGSYLKASISLGLILTVLSIMAPEKSLELNTQYASLLAAYALLSHCSSLLLSWASKDMPEKKIRGLVILWGCVTLLCILPALHLLDGRIASCGHWGCSGG